MCPSRSSSTGRRSWRAGSMVRTMFAAGAASSPAGRLGVWRTSRVVRARGGEVAARLFAPPRPPCLKPAGRRSRRPSWPARSWSINAARSPCLNVNSENGFFSRSVVDVVPSWSVSPLTTWFERVSNFKAIGVVGVSDGDADLGVGFVLVGEHRAEDADEQHRKGDGQEQRAPVREELGEVGPVEFAESTHGRRQKVEGEERRRKIEGRDREKGEVLCSVLLLLPSASCLFLRPGCAARSA